MGAGCASIGRKGGAMQIRNSSIADFLRCRRRYYYAWVENLRPIAEEEHLKIGELFHQSLKKYYSAGPEEAIRSLPDSIHAEKVKRLLIAYIEHYKGNDFTPQIAEETFSANLPNGCIFTFTPDLIVKHGDTLAIVEHKTTSRDIDEFTTSLVHYDQQTLRYMAGLRQIGININTVIFNVVQITGPEFVRREVQRDERLIEKAWQELLVIAEEVRKEKVFLMSYNELCRYCPYEVLCLAEKTGLDSTIIKEGYFIKEEHEGIQA